MSSDSMELGEDKNLHKMELIDLPLYLQNYVIKRKESKNNKKITSLQVFLVENDHNPHPDIDDKHHFIQAVSKVFIKMSNKDKQYYNNLAKIVNNML
ncbi:MAG: hypothetical protein WD512_14235 [Candidatus Paceibacterota bacterium]